MGFYSVPYFYIFIQLFVLALYCSLIWALFVSVIELIFVFPGSSKDSLRWVRLLSLSEWSPSRGLKAGRRQIWSLSWSTPHSADLDVSSSTAPPLPPVWRLLSSVNIRITMHRWWRSGQSCSLTSSEVSWCSCKTTAWTMTGGLELLTWEEKAIGIGQAVLLQLGTFSGKKTNLMLVFIGTVCC